MTANFDDYRVVCVNDERASLPDKWDKTTYAVIGSNHTTITDSGGWDVGAQKVLWTTELDHYDGGRQAGEAFIDGYKSALPMRMVETGVISGCFEAETRVDSPEGHAGKG